jgi:hypothetical protein
MTGRSFFLYGLILLLIVKSGMTQIVKSNDFIVVTFETIKKKPNVTQLYHWITPVDSIVNEIIINLYPLYTEEYSFDVFEECLKGDTIDIFTTSAATNFNFSQEYFYQMEEFQSILKNNRNFVQGIVKRWKNKNKKKKKEKINIYVTPISGVFCTCIQVAYIHGQPYLNFLSQVYMPVSTFSYNSDFWQTEQGETLMFTDFSRIDFSSHLPIDTYGRFVSNARAFVTPIVLEIKH